MPVLLARHGFSAANDKESAAFGHPDARLMLEGRDQAKNLGATLETSYGVDLQETPVAVSQLFRSPETAIEAGFRKMTINPLLNEVASGLEETGFRAAIAARELPEAAREAAERVLDSPPPEGIWISHGLLIAGLCEILQIAQDQRFIPKFCEVRELPI